MQSKRRELLCRMAAAAAVGRGEEFARHAREAVAIGVPPADLQEATLQVFLFAGYPRTIVALEALAPLVGGSAPPQEETPGDLDARGRALFGRIYGEDAEKVLSRLRSLHPEFTRFVLRDAYGLVLARPFLPLVERELLAVAMLGALALPAQLRSHVRGALRVGAAPEELRAAAAAAFDGAALAREVVERELAGR